MTMPPSSAVQVSCLSYTDLVALIRETNRCPGGRPTLTRIADLTRLDRECRVLEIGCTTGFNSIELSIAARCHVTGIDLSSASIEEANRRKAMLPAGLAKRLCFEAVSLFDFVKQVSEPFDLVLASGVTSFIQQKDSAVRNYERLVAPGGYLAITNLFYRTPLPPLLLDQLSAVLGTSLPAWSRDRWLQLFTSCLSLELYHHESHSLQPASQEALDAHIETLFSQPHLAALSTPVREALSARWVDIMALFNQNHRHLGYLIALFRNAPLPFEPQIFYGEALRDE